MQTESFVTINYIVESWNVIKNIKVILNFSTVNKVGKYSLYRVNI